MASSSVFPDESRVRELADQIRARCVHAQQLKLSGQHTTPPGSLSLQAEEIQKRLTETVFRLQEAVRDFSLSGVENRLRLVAQKLSLSFDVQVKSFFLSCDAFLVEVTLQENGHVTSVKLVQGHNQQEDCEFFVLLLREHRYTEFEAHLRQLGDLYSHAGPTPQDKVNFYLALSAMEKVLQRISESSPHLSLGEMIMSNPLGHLTTRKGGQPMALAYFVHPYEVHRLPALRSQEKDATPPEGVAETASILMEKTAKQQVYRLSIDPNLFNPTRANFYALSTKNSAPLAVTFSLRLGKPIPVSAAIKEKLVHSVFGKDQTIPPFSGPHINELIAGQKAEKILPGQRHYYFLQSSLTSSPPGGTTATPSPEHIKPSERGTVISSIQFTHPVQIFTIITLLRKQLMYNTLLASCLKKCSEPSSAPPDHSVSEYVLHVSTTPPDVISVSLDMLRKGIQEEDDRRLSFDIVIPDQQPTQPVVRVCVGRAGGAQVSSVSPTLLTEILRRCLSIPILLRACLQHPSSLGEEASGVLTSYEKMMEDFRREVMPSDDPLVEEGGTEESERTREEIVDLVIPMDGDSDGTSVVEELVYAGMKRKWAE